jgi:hypothetical protein
MSKRASCCCGNVSIVVNQNPVLQSVCHCRNCKQRTGSAFGISAYFLNNAILEKTGDTTIYRVDADSNGNRQERHFCARCGTTVYWTISALPSWTGIAGGCFAENPLPAPDYTLVNAEKCVWLQLPQDWKTSIQWRGLLSDIAASQ